MKIRVAILCLCLFATVSMAAENFFIIKDIRIEGLERVPDGTLLNYLPVQVGDPLDDSQIIFSIRELYKTGFFADIQLLRDGDTLVVKVKERPSLADIEITGSEIEDDLLDEVLEDKGLVKGHVFNQSILENLVKELEAIYFSQGKYGVQIETEVAELDHNRVDIKIIISEGKIALIKQVNIIGNEVFSDEELLSELEIGVPGYFEFLSDSDEYSKQRLSADIETLRSYYQDRGYIQFSTDSTLVSITPDKKDIYVTINITEGEQYTISSVDITGDLVVEKSELMKLILMKSGDLFSRKNITDSQKLLKDRLSKDGYAFSKIVIQPEISDEKNQAALIFQIIPGNKVYIRNINFSGNYKTYDDVLRREMRLFEGSVLAGDKLERSKIRLQRLRYLGEVNIDTARVEGADDLVDLEVTVVEQLSGSFNIGAGVSQTQGFLFNVGLTQENLFGSGQRLDLNINTNQANTIYSVSFTDPYHTIDGISRTIQASFRERDAAEELINSFQTNSYGASITYGIPLTELNTLRLGYGYEHISVVASTTNPSTEVTLFIADNGAEFDSLTLAASFIHDTRNRTVFATKGSSQFIGIDLTAPGSDLEYYKISYRNKFYFTLTEELTLLLRSNVGYGDGYGNTNELPFFQRFFAGGLRTVRGYDRNSLGPLDSISGLPIGGDLRVTAGADVIFPVPFVEKPPSTVRFSAFYDIGNVYLVDAPTFNSTKNGFDAEQLRTSLGISFVWLAPIGPLRFSWAKPLNNVPGDDLRRFQFSIGSFF